MTMETTGTVRDEMRSGTGEFGQVEISWAVVSDVGLLRETNEDAALVGPGMLLVADGMGGHDCGELASEAALSALSDTAITGINRTRDSVMDLLSEAQRQIEDIDTADSGRRAGTTITGAMLVDNDGVPHWLVLNIGDSRTYRMSHGRLEQVTVDHSQVQELVDAGFLTAAQARVDPRRNVITRALGAGMEQEADFFTFPVEVGDRIMVCSDGLTGELTDDSIATILADLTDPAQAAQALVAAALEAGGRDNITVAIADATAVPKIVESTDR
ncbi:protein phosphatase 2C domain-containing protein [Williamsia sp. 1135]|uniref:PP2C family protein-serine/threonine phosphatase n=1 Tax=Williamsia sp. 1135 TaxID=1889262 RepID=UPI001F0AD207|nr:protein phosphatase 2C domain-containing protein [Williamsia sp. 1135]